MPVSSPPPAFRDVGVIKRYELPTVRALLDCLSPFPSKIPTRLAIASTVSFKNKQFNKPRNSAEEVQYDDQMTEDMCCIELLRSRETYLEF